MKEKDRKISHIVCMCFIGRGENGRKFGIRRRENNNKGQRAEKQRTNRIVFLTKDTSKIRNATTIYYTYDKSE